MDDEKIPLCKSCGEEMSYNEITRQFECEECGDPDDLVDSWVLGHS